MNETEDVNNLSICGNKEDSS